MIYAGKKDKEILGFVDGVLSLAEAAATAIGVRAPFVEEHSYFVPLVIYLVGAGLITTVVVHIYNRVILWKLKKMRPFSGQETSKSDFGETIKMSGDINNQKEEVEKLNRLGRLVDKYAQSRSLGLWVSVAVSAINIILVLGSMQLCVVLACRRSWWWWAPLVGAGLWGLISTVWLWRFDRKHGHRFYDLWPRSS
jgi:hypothetical protein